MVVAITGVRRGEVLGLRWADVDLNGARNLNPQRDRARRYDVLESSPKSHQARVVELDPLPVEMLRAHRRRRCEELGHEPGERELVVCAEGGSPIHPQSSSQAFARLIERADLRRIRLHDLHHTHAKIAVKAGVPVKGSERLGHESPAFILKQYAHVVPGMQTEAPEQIAALVGS